MEILSTALNNLYAVVLVVLGLGFVVFIHELGHFLLAKWAGVKVPHFALGFGPVIVSWRKGMGARFGSTSKEYEKLTALSGEIDAPESATPLGETEYSIRALPLGGFVSLWGEEPGDEATKAGDPRAYRNKPVGARMAIISAGVIMNLIFGFLCCTSVYLRGTVEEPAIVGAVVPGRPAYEAGIRSGDEFLAVDGKTDIAFKDVLNAVMLSGEGHKLRFTIRRPGQAEPFDLDVEPRRMAGDLGPTIGFRPAQSLDLAGKTPKELVGDDNHIGELAALGPVGGKLTPVASPDDAAALFVKYRDKPLVATAKIRPIGDDRTSAAKTEAETTLPLEPFRDFGMTMTVGPVASVRPGSPAVQAGLLKGDRIVAIDGKADLDPLRIPDLIYAKAGKSVEIQVKRKPEGKAEETVTLTATPDPSPPWMQVIFPSQPLEVPGLGIGLTVEPIVSAVVPGSPASKGGIKVGDVVRSLPARLPDDKGKKDATPPGEPTWPKPLVLGTDASWPFVFDLIQDVKGPVRILVGGADPKSETREVSLTAEPVADWFNPMRGLRFASMLRKLPPQGLSTSLRRGWRDTQEVAFSIFSTIRSLVQGRLGSGAVGGPLKIGEWAFKTAKIGGLGAFIPFLGLLSINLAVINFFPIPPLDGGQMTFLIAEKVRGRPLPENAVLYPTIVGVGLVLILFASVFLKDLLSYFL